MSTQGSRAYAGASDKQVGTDTQTVAAPKPMDLAELIAASAVGDDDEPNDDPEQSAEAEGFAAVAASADAAASVEALDYTAHDGDPYDATQTDPNKSNGALSSLWEIEALRAHYLPQVSRVVSELTDEVANTTFVSKHSHRDYVHASFESILDQALSARGAQGKRNKKRKRGKFGGDKDDQDSDDGIPLTFTEPTGLFASAAYSGWATS